MSADDALETAPPAARSDVLGVASRADLYHAMIAPLAPAVFQYLVGLTAERATAEDLTQDVLAQAYRRLGDVRDPDHARGWLFAIATNAARAHHRRRRWQWLAPGTAHRVAPDVPDREEMHDLKRFLADVLGRLAASDREVLLLFGYLGLSHREAATSLGISARAAEKRWQRARDRFIQVAREQGYDDA